MSDSDKNTIAYYDAELTSEIRALQTLGRIHNTFVFFIAYELTQ